MLNHRNELIAALADCSAPSTAAARILEMAHFLEDAELPEVVAALKQKTIDASDLVEDLENRASFKSFSIRMPLPRAADGPSPLAVANLECLCEYDPYLHEFDRHPQGIAIHCGKAYIAARAAGLVVADVSTPDKPVTLGRLEPDSESVNGVAVAPHHGRVYALLASQAQWEVIDVTEPASFKPVWKEDIDTFGPWDVAADGCRALLALGSKGVRALNIANPMAPVTLATVEDIGHTWSVAMRGPLGLAASDEALFTIDIRDISRPRVLGRIDVGGAAKKVWRVGAYAYVYCGSDALAVVDISNPSQMVLLGDCNPENRMHGAVFQAGYAWVADVDSGVKVFKVVVTDEPWDFQSRQSPPLGLKYPRSGD